MFAVGVEWVRDLEQETREDTAPVGEADRALLSGLARDIWRFFEDHVGAEGNFLPPDNVQADPPWARRAGHRRRTSGST